LFSSSAAVLFLVFLFVFSRQGCRQIAFDIEAVLCGQGRHVHADNPSEFPQGAVKEPAVGTPRGLGTPFAFLHLDKALTNSGLEGSKFFLTAVFVLEH
jgi:hypothetical protein